MRFLLTVLSFPFLCMIFLMSIVALEGCVSAGDTIIKLEMNLVDNMDGGTNMDINIDCVKKTGTVISRVNGIAPDDQDSIKPQKLPHETVTAIINHLNTAEIDKLKSNYSGKENNHLKSTLKFTTKKRNYDISVSGDSGDDYIRKLHKLAYGIEF